MFEVNVGQDMSDGGFDKTDSSQPSLSQRRKRKPVPKPPKVFVLDDDAAEVEAIHGVLVDEKFHCSTFTQPQECIAAVKKGGCDVLLCDLVMPEMDGHQVFEHIREVRPDLPVIFVTGHGSIPIAVTATKNGAADFLEKPFDKMALIETIRKAMRDTDKARSAPEVKLSKSELIVLKLIMKGNGNRHIAQMLGKSIRTIEDHRSRLMRKMGVDSVVELVKRAIDLGLDDGSIPDKMPED
jgi:FixJ family two-component response regulator